MSNNAESIRVFYGPDVGRHSIVGAFGDRSLLGRIDERDLLATDHTGEWQDTVTVFRYWPTGGVDTIGRFFNTEFFSSGTSTINLPFGREAVYAVGNDRFHYGTASDYELRTYTLAGELVRIARAQYPLEPLTQDDIDAFVQLLTSMGAPETRAWRAQLYEELSFPEFKPAYTRLVEDADGNVWARGDGTWTIFRADGAFLGAIEIPSNFSIHDIGSDYLLGARTDDLGVQRLVMYRIIKQ